MEINAGEAALRSFVESEELTIGETIFMGSADDKGPFMVVVAWTVTFSLLRPI